MLSITPFLFPSSPDLLLEQITCSGQTLFLTLRSSRRTGSCPDCAASAEKVHSFLHSCCRYHITRLYGSNVFLYHLSSKSSLGHIVLDESEQIGDIISGKLGLRSHHKPSCLRVSYEQTCMSIVPLSMSHTRQRSQRHVNFRRREQGTLPVLATCGIHPPDEPFKNTSSRFSLLADSPAGE